MAEDPSAHQHISTVKRGVGVGDYYVSDYLSHGKNQARATIRYLPFLRLSALSSAGESQARQGGDTGWCRCPSPHTPQ